MPVTWLAEDEWTERELRGVLKLSGGGPDTLLSGLRSSKRSLAARHPGHAALE